MVDKANGSRQLNGPAAGRAAVVCMALAVLGGGALVVRMVLHPDPNAFPGRWRPAPVVASGMH